MSTSFYAALAGLNTNRAAIDVIGHNLANINTIGFKKSFASFADVLGSTLSGSVNGAGNPMEIGLGSRMAAIDQVFSQGSLRTSGEATDMAIQGAGFFILSGATGTSYSRAGNFSFDDSGSLVSPSGKFVQGYMADATGTIDTASGLTNINVSGAITSDPNATTELRLSALLDADATPEVAAGEFAAPVRVFDSLGVAHTLTFVFRREDVPAAGPAGTAVEWNFDIRIDGGDVAAGTAGTPYSILNLADVGDPPTWAGDFPGTLYFDSTGQLLRANIGGTDYDQTDAIIPDIVGLTSGADDLSISWDIVDDNATGYISSFASDAGSAASSTYQDGFGVGSLNSILVDTDGTITGLFSNGDVRDLAQVALANFNNPQGLFAVGNNEYVETPGSGQASVGAPDSGGRGSISGATLELSNVDLAEEFTQLILSERGFQANSRVISTTDTLLQEAIQLTR